MGEASRRFAAWVVATVGVVILVTTTAVSQSWDPRFATLEVRASVYERIRTDIDRALGRFEDAYRGVVPQTVDDVVCVFLAGTGGGTPRVDGGGGGTPRVDGGGGGTPRVDGGGLTGLALRPIDGDHPAISAGNAFRTVDVNAAANVTHLVIVDAFDLTALAGAFSTAAPTIDVNSSGRPISSESIDTYLQTATIGAGADVRENELVVPHGHLVLYHVLALLSGELTSVGAFTLDHIADQHGGPYSFGAATLSIELLGQPLEIHLLSVTFDTVETLRDALAHAGAELPQESVLVTSWGVVDCSLLELYAESDPAQYPSIGALLHDLWETHFAQNPDAYDILDIICEGLGGDLLSSGDCYTPAVAAAASFALIDLIAQEAVGWPQHDDHVLFGRIFASSGNQSLPFPMPPASWTGILGVDACIGSGPDQDQRAWFANLGDHVTVEHVRAPAEGYFVVAPSALTFENDGRRIYDYWGTSFAAPHAALVVGGDIDLLQAYYGSPLLVGACAPTSYVLGR